MPTSRARTSSPDRTRAARPAAPPRVVSGNAPPRATAAPSTFVDDPGRRPRYDGKRFFRLRRLPGDGIDCRMRAEVRAERFAGWSTASFRDEDLAEFVDHAREFAAGRRAVAAIQGGTWDEDGGLLQVLIGIHVYRPGPGRGHAALRIVIASEDSDDLLTTTLASEPIHIAQFADAIAAIAGGARDHVTLIAR